ncbi:MAG: 4-hydroxy-tetrahydrodipicolinate synthase [Dehalococcoidia bacterium]|nr:4-hydroxy-tetrahydrodipicolinate synthase [Dehalococcoidia bacterium]
MGSELHGIIPAMVTPFTSEEQLNEQALRALVNRLIDDGVHGVFVLGSQGEYYALDHAEKRRAIEVTVEAAGGRVPVYAGTGSTTTRDAVTLTQMAERAGADAVSVITPTFITPSQEELYDHYRTIAGSTRLPVLLYSNPGRTGVTISVELASRLAQIDNIAGIKDSSGDLSTTAAFIAATPDRFKVFAGRDTLVFATVLYGGAGAVAASGNVAARHLVRLYNACRAGDLELARDTQAALAPLRAAFSLGTFPAVIKEALRMTGLDAGPCRRPVGPLNEQARAQLQKVLDELGLLRGV